eukprot:m.11555 g.11555  ORF g.11555 m.11555 type:complete len:188 (+) comp2639_c0_seq1:57-620(+)
MRPAAALAGAVAAAALLCVAAYSDEILVQVHEPSKVAYTYITLSPLYHGGIFDSFLDHVRMVLTEPEDACVPLEDSLAVKDSVALIVRGNCAFWEKCVHAQAAGARAVIVYDNNADNIDEWIDMNLESETASPPITIPTLFALGRDGTKIASAIRERAARGRPYSVVSLPMNSSQALLRYPPWSLWI